MSGPNGEGPLPAPRSVAVNVRFRQSEIDRLDAAVERHRQSSRSNMIRALVTQALDDEDTARQRADKDTS